MREPHKKLFVGYNNHAVLNGFERRTATNMPIFAAFQRQYLPPLYNKYEDELHQ